MKKILLSTILFLITVSFASAVTVSSVEILELGGDGFVVGWTTDVPTTSQVLYGTSGGLGKGTSIQTSLATEHQVQVSGLQEGTVYFYRVTGQDANGNTYESQISLTRTYGTSSGSTTNTQSTSTAFGVGQFNMYPVTTPYQNLQNGAVIDLSTLPSNAILGATSDGQVGSTINFINGVYSNTEVGEPWEFPRTTLVPGTYTFTVVPYDIDCEYNTATCNGVQGISKSITLTFVNGATTNTGSTTTTPSGYTPSGSTSMSADLIKIQNEFDAAWDYEKSRHNSLSQKAHQGDMYYWFATFDGNLAIFQATGETKYLDEAIKQFDTITAKALPANQFPSSKLPAYTNEQTGSLAKYNDNYLSWDNHGDRVTGQGVTNGGQAPLYDSHGLRQVPKLLWVLYNSPQLRANGYQDDYDRIKTFMEKHMWDKWMSRGSNNIYRSRTHMASHWANIAMYMYEIEENPTRKAQYKEVMDNFNHDMGAGSSNYPKGIGMRDQLRPHPKASGGYVWDGVWGGTGANDHSHANAEVNFMINSHELGYEYTDADMKALQITLNDVLFLDDAGRGEVPYYLNGNFRADYRNTAWFDHGWSMLGRFNPALQKRLMTRDLDQSKASYYRSTFWGNMAYNQAYLDGTIQYPESFRKTTTSTTTSKPSTTTNTPTTSTAFGIGQFNIYNSQYQNLQNGAVIDLSTLPSNAILGATSNGQVGSTINFINGVYANTEIGEPWEFLRDIFKPGTYTFTVVPYDIDCEYNTPTCDGVRGVPKSITLTFIAGTSTNTNTNTNTNTGSTQPTTTQTDNGKLINNQAVFSAKQAAEIKRRIDNGWNHPAGPGYPEDEAWIINRKNDFMRNPDVGEWDNFNLDDGANADDAPTPAYGVTDEIHYAAIYAYLYNDKEVANAVANKIIEYAKDPDLDIKQNVIDNNFKTRYPLTNPWLRIAPRFVKFIESYALVAGIADISPSDDQIVAQWFKDWRDVFWDSVDFHLDETFGNNWNKNDYRTTAWNYLVDSNHPNGELFVTSTGKVIPGYSFTRSQGSLHNIRAEMVGYLHAYGVYYNNKEDIDNSLEFWKTALRLGHFADGTTSEMTRSVTPSSYISSGYEQQGLHYQSITLGIIAKMALRHKIASINGLPNIDDQNAFFEFETSQGTDDYPNMKNHAGASTSGGPKSLLTATKAHLNFYRQPGGQGWSPIRYANGVLLQGRHMGHRPLAAMLNIYYHDPELEAGWKHTSSYGYPPPVVGQNLAEYRESNNGAWDTLYGLMYWADIDLE